MTYAMYSLNFCTLKNTYYLSYPIIQERNWNVSIRVHEKSN